MLSQLPVDPERFRMALAAMAGAFIYGVFTLVTLFMTGAHVSRRDLMRALLNVAAAAVCGVITAVVIGPALLALIPVASMRDGWLVGFAIGALTWEALPFGLNAFRRFARTKAEAQGADQ